MKMMGLHFGLFIHQKIMSSLKKLEVALEKYNQQSRIPGVNSAMHRARVFSTNGELTQRYNTDRKCGHFIWSTG